MTVDTEKGRNHYFDFLKYLLFIFVVLIHNPLPENLWGYGRQSHVAQFLHISPFQAISAKEQEKSSLKRV